jgi:predicted NBD/HSP70 family sugar kinase
VTTTGPPSDSDTRPRHDRPERKALPTDARRHNRSLVLRTLFRAGPLSRADLARETHLTRVTTSDLVGELVDNGFVEELGVRTDQGVGKPARLVGLVADAGVSVALDLSDDREFRGALIDLSGRVLGERSVRRNGRRGEAAAALVSDLAADLVAASTRPLLGCGVGSPGVVDDAGVVLEAPNLDWYGFDLAAHLAPALPCPVHVANDANTAAMGELTFGPGEERNLLLVKIGHGVGAGLVIDGRLVLGSRFAAGEIGHVVVEERGEPCACGRTGCLETVVAAPAIRRRLRADGASREKVLTAAGRRFGVALAPVVSTLNLRAVVLSGSPDLFGDSFCRSALDTIHRRTMPAVGDLVDLRRSTLAENDVLLGAAVLVLDGELGIS